MFVCAVLGTTFVTPLVGVIMGLFDRDAAFVESWSVVERFRAFRPCVLEVPVWEVMVRAHRT